MEEQMYEYTKRELAKVIHQMWMTWSKDLAQDLGEIRNAIKSRQTLKAIKTIDENLQTWYLGWGNYESIEEKEIKDMIQKWTQMVVAVLIESKPALESSKDDQKEGDKDGRA